MCAASAPRKRPSENQLRRDAKLGDLVAGIGLFEVKAGSGSAKLVRNKD